MADLWWSLATKSKNPLERKRYAIRARWWFEQAQADAAGILKPKVEKRLREIEESGLAKVSIDLLRLVDLQKHVDQEKWRSQGGKLIAEGPGRCVVEIPYEPPEEYDITVRFTVQPTGTQAFQAIVRFRGCVGWHMGGGANKKTFGFFTRTYADNKMKEILEVSRVYTSLVQVRKDKIAGFVNGELVSEWKAERGQLGCHPDWQPKNDGRPALGAEVGSVCFLSAEVVELRGRGKILR
jgi:hypothetical protein